MPQSEKPPRTVGRRPTRKRGMQAFKVVGLERDKGLIRSVARILAADDRDAASLRELLSDKPAVPCSARGGILGALRRSPLVGANLDLRRSSSARRRVSRPFDQG